MSCKIIELPVVDFEQMKVLEVIHHFFELHDDCIIQRIKYWADEPIKHDKALGYKTILTNWTIVADRSSIVAIEYFYLPVDNLWKLRVSVTGLAMDIQAYFNKEKEGREVLRELMQYRFLNTQNANISIYNTTENE